MTLKKTRPSAYQGRGWVPRKSSSTAERSTGLWSPMSSDSEFRPLRAVLLHRPGRELEGIRDPNRVQHLEKINRTEIAREFDRLAAAYQRLGIQVHWVDTARFKLKRNPPFPNLMYARDSFFMTREGAMIARMASLSRAGEEKFAARSLGQLAVPILRTIQGRALFEGADALWIDSRTVLCGVGNRTNEEGFRQLRDTLAAQGIDSIRTPLPSGVQHLLGVLQIVDRRTALFRNEIAPPALKTKLKRLGFSLIEVPEWDEVIHRQGMNIVTVRARVVVMPAGCPRLKELYRRSGLKVAAEVKIDELIKGAGGIACATGILSRDPA